MGFDNTGVELIRAAIRAAQPPAAQVPLVFLAGHTHIRTFQRLDDDAAVLESGRYFDTVGLISYDPPVAPSNTWFEFQYIDTTLASLQEASRTTPDSFPTAAGAEVREKIALVRDMFRLDEVLGCTPPGAPSRFRRASSLDQTDSLINLALTEVFPSQIMNPPAVAGADERQIVIAGTGGIRYDIFEGEVTRDDTMIVSPFRDRFYSFTGLSAAQASGVLEAMDVFLPGDPNPLPFGSMVATSAPDLEQPDKLYSVICLDFDLSRVRTAVQNATADPTREEMVYRPEIDATVVWELFASERWAQFCDNDGQSHYQN